jgi:hypothetical protein
MRNIPDIKRTHAFADIAARDVLTGNWTSLCRRALGHAPDAYELTHTYADQTQVFMAVTPDRSLLAILSADRRHMSVDAFAHDLDAKDMVKTIRAAARAHTANHQSIDRVDLPEKEKVRKKDAARARYARLATADFEIASPVSSDALLKQIDYEVRGQVFKTGGEKEDTLTLIRPCDDKGVSALTLFRDAKGAFGFVDLHAAPAQNYISQSVMLPGTGALDFISRLRGNLTPVRGMVTTVGREPLPALTSVFTRVQPTSLSGHVRAFPALDPYAYDVI